MFSNESKIALEVKNENKIEPLLDPNQFRYTVFPITFKEIWSFYEKQESIMWKTKEIDFSKDYDDFVSLSNDEQHFIKYILAFFAFSDGLVNFNIGERFLKDVQVVEARITYDFQKMMENIHGQTYSLMLDNIIRDPEEKHNIFNAVKNVPSIKLINDWAEKWIHSEKSFAHRLVAFAVIEGVLFSGAFASIFWLKKYKGSGQLFMNGFIKSNEFIARDEGLHTDFACCLYDHLLYTKLTFDDVKSVVGEGVEITKNFMIDALKCELIGMNSKLMNQYIEYVADRLYIALGYEKVYKSENPFDFMNTIGMVQKTNFFESRPTEYQSVNDGNGMNLNVDF